MCQTICTVVTTIDDVCIAPGRAGVLAKGLFETRPRR